MLSLMWLEKLYYLYTKYKLNILSICIFLLKYINNLLEKLKERISDYLKYNQGKKKSPKTKESSGSSFTVKSSQLNKHSYFLDAKNTEIFSHLMKENVKYFN